MSESANSNIGANPAETAGATGSISSTTDPLKLLSQVLAHAVIRSCG
jgi:hypothetical protein